MREEAESGKLPRTDHWRPQRRSDCESAPRPCPYVACPFHLFTDVTECGSIRFPFGDDLGTLRRMEHTCALDAAEAGGMTLDQVARLSNVTRERVRQVERKAMDRIRDEVVDPDTGEWGTEI